MHYILQTVCDKNKTTFNSFMERRNLFDMCRNTYWICPLDLSSRIPTQGNSWVPSFQTRVSWWFSIYIYIVDKRIKKTLVFVNVYHMDMNTNAGVYIFLLCWDGTNQVKKTLEVNVARDLLEMHKHCCGCQNVVCVIGLAGCDPVGGVTCI